jgi:peptide/nickel transport system ATP-binding protein/oligopeptide transport system ATP-binding protein
MREALRYRKNRIKDKKREKELILNILEELKITDPEDIISKYPHQLSGGMKQRIVVAIALLLQAQILIADEPTTSLDVTIQFEVVELINRIRKDFGMSVILISHDLNLLSDYCDRIVVMYGGIVLESGKTRMVYEQPKSPYTKALIRCIPPLEGDMSNFEPIPGEIVDPRNPPRGCPFHPRCTKSEPKCKNDIPELLELEEERFVRCFYPN